MILFGFFLIATLRAPIEIPFLEESPNIDGVLSEGEWTETHMFSEYYTQIDPDFGKKIEDKTVAKIGYDKKNLYVLFEAHQDLTTLVEKKGTRDNSWDQDAVAIMIDPLGTKQEYYMIFFGLSGTICDMRKFRASTSGDEDETWDADAVFATGRTDSGYIVESQIPFSNFRRSGKEEVLWNINLFRRIEHMNCQALYSPLNELSNEAEYESFIPILLTGIGERERIEVIPYGIYGSTFDSLTIEHGNAGFDMKIPLGATGVANFAFNPDFSQLEGDPLEFDFYAQYAIYFPEYRPFFIEERGVFQTDPELYYSRQVQNPILAGRYTYKDPNNQAGILFAYDEEDSVIENTDAIAAILRYTRQYGRNNAGLMLLNRYDLSDDYDNIALMTDGNFYLPFNVKLTYQLAATSTISSPSDDIFSNVGFYHHLFTTYVTQDWIVLGNFFGLSQDFSNDLGYVPRVDKNYVGGYLGRRFYFDNNIVKNIEISENFGFTGSWSRFDDYLLSARDSMEYFAETGLHFSLFTSTFYLLKFHIEKTFWEDVYLERWSIRNYAESKLNEYIEVEGSFNGGYLIDYNIAAVGKYYSGHGNILCSPLSVLTLNMGVNFAVFNADTTRQALKPQDVKKPVFTWRTLSPDIGLSFNPTNSLSFRVVAQRQTARFTPGYDEDEDEEQTEDRIFGVIEYKPSIRNVIYLGGRYPEKGIFFKFTHRFML